TNPPPVLNHRRLRIPMPLRTPQRIIQRPLTVTQPQPPMRHRDLNNRPAPPRELLLIHNHKLRSQTPNKNSPTRNNPGGKLVARRRRGNAPSSPQRQRGARLQRKRPPRGRPPYTHNKPPVAGNNRSLPHQEPTPTRGLSPNK